MNKEELLELYKTERGRKEIVFDIINQDNLSITNIVKIKEEALTKKREEDNELISGLAMRSTVMFDNNTENMIERIKEIKPLVAKDIIKSGVVEGTVFEEELLKEINI
ncbi:MAG: hypothetical protein PHR33_02930 [Bacilli bacterium]|nr:hypothetical protein [Bacilli bacterium]